ncbi:MAG: dTDP-4-dehydrorhamnose reductase [Candidatus Sulfotelmatobacter sp.]
MRKIAVIGGNGQLGHDVVEAFDGIAEVYSLTHQELELSDIDSAATCLRALHPDIVVNAAAMHHVENCERDPARAYAVNALGVRNLAHITDDLDAILIHVSTDYVFDGRKGTPYTEDDLPLPLNVYGSSKLAGEYFTRTGNQKHIVLRTSALYGRHPCRGKGGENFVDVMLRLGRERGEVRVVDSERITPTSTRDLAQQIVVLSDAGAYGLFHATAEGICSWHEFACEIFAAAGIRVRCLVAQPEEFPAKVARPEYSVLDNAGLKQAGLNRFRHWREGLQAYLAQDCSAVA